MSQDTWCLEVETYLKQCAVQYLERRAQVPIIFTQMSGELDCNMVLTSYACQVKNLHSNWRLRSVSDAEHVVVEYFDVLCASEECVSERVCTSETLHV
jgi:hypothetical protein